MRQSFRACLLILSLCCASLAWSAEPADEASLVVEDLRCRGNVATACDFILGYVYLERGDELDETEVRNAQLRLATLRVFDSVTLFLEKGSERGKAVIVIDVVEADPITTEWLVGASYRLSAFRSVTAGRLTHQNLFGEGKLADLSISTVQPLNGPREQAYNVGLRYADPHLFGSTRYFGVVGASYVDGDIVTRDGNFGSVTVLRLGASLGRRIWDFSYLTLGYGYRAKLDLQSARWQRDGTFELKDEHSRHAIDVLYGWNSEDDLYFPTHGSSFHTGFGWNFGDDEPDNEFHLQFRKTWALADGFVSLKLGGDPSPEYRQTFSESQLVSVSYAQPVATGDFVRRGRWYIDAGYNSAGFAQGGRALHEFGIKLGLRLETQTLGLIDLYVLGTEDTNR